MSTNKAEQEYNNKVFIDNKPKETREMLTRKSHRKSSKHHSTKLNLLSINPYMIGLTTLLMANDLVTIGNTADTTGPGGSKNLPFNAVNKDIVKCGK
jgi:hypothetical protein